MNDYSKKKQHIKDYVIERDGSICCYCDKVLKSNEVTLDHILPNSKRGAFNTTNLTIACAECNSKRGNVPFFEYCEKFNWPQEKIAKYKKLYSSNLKIKVLNIAKENINPNAKEAVPKSLISAACHILGIKKMDFSDYEKRYFFTIIFSEWCEVKRIKLVFEELIKIIEAESKI
jgi:hypothetical protein